MALSPFKKGTFAALALSVVLAAIVSSVFKWQLEEQLSDSELFNIAIFLMGGMWIQFLVWRATECHWIWARVGDMLAAISITRGWVMLAEDKFEELRVILILAFAALSAASVARQYPRLVFASFLVLGREMVPFMLCILFGRLLADARHLVAHRPWSVAAFVATLAAQNLWLLPQAETMALADLAIMAMRKVLLHPILQMYTEDHASTIWALTGVMIGFLARDLRADRRINQGVDETAADREHDDEEEEEQEEAVEVHGDAAADEREDAMCVVCQSPEADLEDGSRLVRVHAHRNICSACLPEFLSRLRGPFRCFDNTCELLLRPGDLAHCLRLIPRDIMTNLRRRVAAAEEEQTRLPQPPRLQEIQLAYANIDLLPSSSIQCPLCFTVCDKIGYGSVGEACNHIRHEQCVQVRGGTVHFCFCCGCILKEHGRHELNDRIHTDNLFGDCHILAPYRAANPNRESALRQCRKDQFLAQNPELLCQQQGLQQQQQQYQQRHQLQFRQQQQRQQQQQQQQQQQRYYQDHMAFEDDPRQHVVLQLIARSNLQESIARAPAWLYVCLVIVSLFTPLNAIAWLAVWLPLASVSGAIVATFVYFGQTVGGSLLAGLIYVAYFTNLKERFVAVHLLALICDTGRNFLKYIVPLFAALAGGFNPVVLVIAILRLHSKPVLFLLYCPRLTLRVATLAAEDIVRKHPSLQGESALRSILWPLFLLLTWGREVSYQLSEGN